MYKPTSELNHPVSCLCTFNLMIIKACTSRCRSPKIPSLINLDFLSCPPGAKVDSRNRHTNRMKNIDFFLYSFMINKYPGQLIENKIIFKGGLGRLTPTMFIFLHCIYLTIKQMLELQRSPTPDPTGTLVDPAPIGNRTHKTSWSVLGLPYRHLLRSAGATAGLFATRELLQEQPPQTPMV